MKRVFDLVVASVAVMVMSPLFVVIAVAVRFDSRGPALFRQVRVGLHGRPFSLLKFRTMTIMNMEAVHRSLVTADDDPRITRVGRILRRAKLDELPQLINVIMGEMSLVGPRPEVPQYVALWAQVQRATILSVRPGLTDPMSIKFRHESALLALQEAPDQFYEHSILPAKAAGYVDYVSTRTFRGDLRILLQTVKAVALPARGGK
jgi:lipopolysaccharide/colanic/teichoic acid biosynthesis glycosyltransferase